MDDNQMDEMRESEMREKYWKELDDKEKIERLREYAQMVDSLRERINRLEARFQNHIHVDGRLYFTANVDALIGTPTPIANSPYDMCEKCRSNVRI